MRFHEINSYSDQQAGTSSNFKVDAKGKSKDIINALKITLEMIRIRYSKLRG